MNGAGNPKSEDDEYCRRHIGSSMEKQAMVWSGKTRMGMDCGATQKTRVLDPPNQSVVTTKATAQIECTVRATARTIMYM